MPPVSQGGNELTTRIRAFGVLVLAVALLLTAVPAYAVPASKMQQARAVKSQIDTLNDRVERASERYNIAAEKHAKVLRQKRTVAKRLKKVEKRMGVVQRHLNTRANSMYRQGPMGFVTVLLGADSFEEFSANWDLLKDLNSDDAASVSELKGLRKQAKAAHQGTRQEGEGRRGPPGGHAAQRAVHPHAARRAQAQARRPRARDRRDRGCRGSRAVATLVVERWRWRQLPASHSRTAKRGRLDREEAIWGPRIAGRPPAPTRSTAPASRCSSTGRSASRFRTVRARRSAAGSA